jgi:hypothetical protein
MILPVAFQKIYPSWLNHLDHTAPGVMVILEAILFPHAVPSRKSGLSVLIFLAASYLAW